MLPVPTTEEFLAHVAGSQFGSAPAGLVSAALASAAKQTNADAFASTEQALEHVFLKAAIFLLNHPLSSKMRSDDSASQIRTWERELKKLQRAATLGLRVF